MATQQWWKDFYANERAALSRAYLEQLIRDAPSIGAHRAIIFPHTRLSGSGSQTAAVAKWVVSDEYEHVLALGVLHGQRPAGMPIATRGIYTKRDRITAEEFSLDNLEVLINLAAEVYGVKAPVLHKRYPFLAGSDPPSLAAYGELQALVQDGAALVATGDLIHHGVGYGTPAHDARERESDATLAWARDAILRQIGMLQSGEWEAFAEECGSVRSDFRDVGPLLASLMGPSWQAELKELRLIDYSDVLEAPAPTWVAAALIVCS